jgi:hypothetical protein
MLLFNVQPPYRQRCDVSTDSLGRRSVRVGISSLSAVAADFVHGSLFLLPLPFPAPLTGPGQFLAP